MSHQDMLYFTLATAVLCPFAWAAAKLWLRSNAVGAIAMGAVAVFGLMVIAAVFAPAIN